VNKTLITTIKQHDIRQNSLMCSPDIMPDIVPEGWNSVREGSLCGSLLEISIAFCRSLDRPPAMLVHAWCAGPCCIGRRAWHPISLLVFLHFKISRVMLCCAMQVAVRALLKLYHSLLFSTGPNMSYGFGFSYFFL
jgi:hypothetical protein